MSDAMAKGHHQALYWSPIGANRIQCDLCPRYCRLHPGQRGFCYVRQNDNGRMVLTTYGRSSGFCVDPIEKKPLNHFFPGSSILSFGTAGCNLGCKFCQNWDISKARDMDRLMARATPERIAQAALDAGCLSVAFTYNDPVIFAEYAIDTARACKELGLKSVAVTAGYITQAARKDFFSCLDAANIDLKAFSERFYKKLSFGALRPVLDTLVYVRQKTSVWLEITTLLIPGENDSDGEINEMCRWIRQELGADVPLHFTAFHPDFKMTDYSPTPPTTLRRARDIAHDHGLHHVYVGNVHDAEGSSTYCPQCRALLIERDWYSLGHYALDEKGHCQACGHRLAGHFAKQKGTWGPRRQRVVL